ncbi:MAG: hypothetical protein PCFJNLEI_00101 [Verrucomicrobiae bacterium]|nr:hypothetical protein [Verrucomicrobiae bacterium]
MFCIWAAPYAPPIGGAPAQVFFGEWTGTTNGADLIAQEVDSDRQTILGFDGIDSTQCLCVDPYRPILWLHDRLALRAIDRLTLEANVVCQFPMQYSMDVDRQKRVWFAQTRSLHCFDPATGELTPYPDVTPDEFFYAPGTHMSLGVAPDGRIWTSQHPIACLAVFDPVTRKTRVVWGTPGKSEDPRRVVAAVGLPVIIGDLVWAGNVFADARTAELVDPPFSGYTLLTRGNWQRTPTALLDCGGRALVRQKRRIGWLEAKSGRFDLIGDLPADAPLRDDWSLHGERTLVAGEMRVDLVAQKTTRVQLRGPYQHPQGMFQWNVGPDGKFYGSCYSHEMWEVDQAGNFKNHGDIVHVHGGELHFFTNWQNKMFVASYTHSVLTRVDVTQPTDNWGTEAANNPRHILNLNREHDGQHRPSAIVATHDDKIFYISRADYCTRREGVLAAVNAVTEQVLHIEDPLVAGEQPWSLAASPTRREIYIGTNRATFVVWDTEAMKIKRTIRIPPRPGDGAMTSAMCEVGTIRFLGAVGDLVVGNIFGGGFEMFTYHADTGVLDLPVAHPQGRVFGIFPAPRRQALLLRINGALYEFDGTTRLLYPEPLPGFETIEGPNGRLYIADKLSIYAETN